ncbi:hypothetical protein GSI_11510 [Ganoderma sinense ZZ0214-1]|uniref:Transporter n=1 Tax=Ganoderma sinense ZZ0214-1 TaxID=1077348 RepID=A0A2G8RSE7_9APHY|nr:hypothetical protein GSI_14189 [Ganoderma sinense ZZ0214-1]PIL25760.1 hypothetical protein GSI_11510 [Ganoderma sinense ZZ0214-1]
MALNMFLLAAATLTSLFPLCKLPRVPRIALWISHVAYLLALTHVSSPKSMGRIYRMTVISHSTTSLFSVVPGSQSSPRDKAAPIRLHHAPRSMQHRRVRRPTTV